MHFCPKLFVILSIGILLKVSGYKLLAFKICNFERRTIVGIEIHLAISKSVTKEEWEKVYEETLKLLEALPLAEKREVNIKGIPTVCLTKAKEQIYSDRWNGDKAGWMVEGDLETMRRAEEFFLPRDITKGRQISEDEEDVILSILPDYIDMECYTDESWRDMSYHPWACRTQNEPYHMCMLAIGCLIESRLGKKALVYGDITGEQCVKALKILDNYLDTPLDTPIQIAVCCDKERLWERVSRLPCDSITKIRIFEYLFIGKKEWEFGEFLRNKCFKKNLDKYWDVKLNDFCMSTYEQSAAIKEYLLMGFESDEVISLVKRDKHTEDSYQEFLKCVEESKAYLEELKETAGKEAKECIETEIWDSFREKLCELWGRDFFELFKDLHNKMISPKKFEKILYDIEEYEDLRSYKEGDTIHPGIMDNLRSVEMFYRDLLQEEEYEELVNGTWEERCKWLQENNHKIVIRDTDWEKIYQRIEEEKEAFARYYPIMRVSINSNAVLQISKAYLINDDIFEVCKKLS